MRYLARLIACLILTLAATQSLAAPGDERPDPRQTARAWVHALAIGDAATAKSLTLHSYDLAKDKADFEFIDAMAACNIALKRVGDAAVGKWGPAGKAIQVRTPADELDISLQNAEVHAGTDGRASIAIGDRDPIRLKRDPRTNDPYRIDLPDMLDQSDQLVQLTPMLKAMTATADGMTTDINNEKFKNADEATQVMQTRLENAMKGYIPGAMNPTTQAAPDKEPTTESVPAPGSGAKQ